MAEFRTAGIVLHRQNFKDADRICRIFTREFGFISVIAKGCKKMKSKKSGTLELFSESNFRLHRRTGELFLVVDALKYSHFSADLPALKVAYSTAEWLLALAPAERPFPQIYEITRAFLKILPRTSKLQLIEIAWRTKIIAQLGFFPDSAEFDMRMNKFFKFLLTSDFSEIIRLIDDYAVFTAAEKILIQIFETTTEKTSRVTATTADWV